VRATVSLRKIFRFTQLSALSISPDILFNRSCPPPIVEKILFIFNIVISFSVIVRVALPEIAKATPVPAVPVLVALDAHPLPAVARQPQRIAQPAPRAIPLPAPTRQHLRAAQATED